MDDAVKPDWTYMLEQQPEEALRPSREDRAYLNRDDEGLQVLDVEGGESAYAESGVLSSTGVRECITVGVLDSDQEVGAMYHLVADDMSAEDISNKMMQIEMEASEFTNPEEAHWYAAGGYAGSPEFRAEVSNELDDSDEAMARRRRVDGYISEMDPASYSSDWIDQDGETLQLYVDVDRRRFIQATDSPEKEHDYDYLR